MARRLDRWLGVELRHLSTFLAVADEASFSRAAASLGYSQSAVSHQIAALERVVGVRVIDRPGGRKPVALTEEGAVLSQHAERILETLAAAEADMRRMLEAGWRLRIGTFPSFGATVLPTIIRYFAAARRRTVVELTDRTCDAELLRLLKAGDIDLAFAVLPLEQGAFDFVELMSDPLVLLVPASSELAKREAPLTLEELDELPLITLEECRRVTRLKEASSSHAVNTRFVHHAEDHSVVQAMVSAGIGAALLPSLALERQFLGASVVRLEVSAPPQTVALAWKRDRSLNDAERFFIEISRRVCDALGTERAERRPRAVAHG
jgi:DNA-binding transcriptional LysR family regulator